MKKFSWIIVILIIIGLFTTGCSQTDKSKTVESDGFQKSTIMYYVSNDTYYRFYFDNGTLNIERRVMIDGGHGVVDQSKTKKFTFKYTLGEDKDKGQFILIDGEKYFYQLARDCDCKTVAYFENPLLGLFDNIGIHYSSCNYPIVYDHPEVDAVFLAKYN